MNNRIRHWVVIVVFLVIIAVPSFGSLPQPGQFWDASDASGPTGWIIETAKAMVKFPGEYSSYYHDHYLLHDWQVDLVRGLRLRWFEEKHFPNVLIGKEDWLFYSGEGNIADFQCTSPFTPEELQRIRDRLLQVDATLQEQGIQFLLVIAPNKESVYPEYLPEGVAQIGDVCRIDQVVEMLSAEETLDILDLRAVIREGKNQGQVYHRTDTHWNDLGALLATRALLSALQVDNPRLSIPELDQSTLQKERFSGDLARYLPLDERWIEEETVLVPLECSEAVLSQLDRNTIEAQIPDSTLPTALVFRDSFMDALIPLLSEHFSRTVYRHSFAVDMDLVQQQQPDIVIYEIAQRYLNMLLTDWDALLASE